MSGLAYSCHGYDWWGWALSLPMAARDPAAGCPEKSLCLPSAALPSWAGEEPRSLWDQSTLRPGTDRVLREPLLSLAAPIAPLVQSFSLGSPPRGQSHPPAPAWTCPLWSSLGCRARGTVGLALFNIQAHTNSRSDSALGREYEIQGTGPAPSSAILLPALFLGCLYKK